MYKRETKSHSTAPSVLVGGRVRVLGGREADLVLRDGVRGVEPLEPRVAVDEVEALAAVRAEVRDDEVDAAGVAAEHAVELDRGAVNKYQRLAHAQATRGRGTYRARPDLSVGGELVGFLSVGREYFIRYADADGGHSRHRC